MHRDTIGCLMGVALLCSACGADDNAEPAADDRAAGCETASLRKNPDDFASAGPWVVGVRTLVIDGLTTEVWYPAPPGSDAGQTPRVYDLRSWLPESEKSKIPDEANPFQSSHSFPDLPVDADRGPYPALIFVHGTAGFRSQSLAQMEHWASRGFVVLAADHPGLFLGDILESLLNQPNRDLDRDLGKLVQAVRNPAPALGFLVGHLDAPRIGMAGHSAGGGAIANQGEVAQVLIPLAAGGSMSGSQLVSTLVMGGQADSVAMYQNQLDGFQSSPQRKRLVGISRAGHLFPSELCSLENAQGQDIVEVANRYQIKNANLASFLFDCPSDEPPPETLRDIVNYASSAALEEVLHCRAGEGFSDFLARYPEVAEYRQEP